MSYKTKLGRELPLHLLQGDWERGGLICGGWRK